MEAKVRFKIIYSEETIKFLNSLDEKAKAKIMYNINKSKYVIDKELFKKLETTDIWEFRTLYNGIAYRLFAFWDTDKEALVLTTHGFIKKTQKTPNKEIAKAEEIREQYFNSKKQ
ncbi:type II toxin-antitoxin system RelE/ParE family toxin [Parabacteroides sp. AF48-14]|uniref:type II toxin-antitoxin system RelE/ParE family toxin n=1 Tax=Parabacteroides sp. AF48-14 TaxID=2292052 RepID=UPI000EFF7A60|nr:type II toxin-antitoxin system RelE/ParE family toxin [Parabacteroides sp. AF48-14]RHO71615.1 type II toxin-antitoxin system RelE/ParE family toxin [Parabacteroides sp. AF48-14]